MDAYNGQRNFGSNRNFQPSFPRNNYGSASDDRSMHMRRPFERDSPMFQRYQDNSGNGSFSPRPHPSFSRFEEQTRGTPMSVDRPMNMTSPMANRVSPQNTFGRPEFSGQGMFYRSEFGGKSMFGGGSDLNNRSAFSRSDMGNRDAFSRPEVTGTFSRPQLRNNDVFSRSPVGNSNMVSRPQVGNSNMFSRPQMGSSGGNMPSRPQMGGSGNMFPGPQMGGMFPRSQFGGKPMSGMPMAPPRMQFPYGGGRVNQRPLPGSEWNLGTNWRARNTSPWLAAQKKPFAAPLQSKPKFKPIKKKSKKKRLPTKMKDDGKKLKPWMTDELYAEVKKKNDMYIKAKATDSTDLWQEFRVQRNKVSSLIKEAKLKGGFITRKRKEDEDDGKEKPFSCDTCDRAFAEESKLEEHLKEHIKCEVNGCHFEAHPKVVELHKKLQHDTGYAEIISKLNDAAEIEKWRNERKSHFPTLENVKKRQAEQEERFARGEVLETKDFGSKNEDVKDSSQDMPEAQQDLNPPEVAGEGREAESGEAKTDSCLGN